MISKCYRYPNCFYNNFIFKIHNAHTDNMRSRLLNGCRYFASVPESSEIKNDTNDSTDPVIKKYRKLLHSLSASQNELVYGTNFGSIRFDSDGFNAQNTHTNFMMDKIHEANSSLDNLKQEQQNKSDVPNNYVDEVYFDSSISSTNQMDTSLKYKNDHHSNVERFRELNYVDEQYIVTGSIENQESESNYNNDISADNLQDSDSNYIDSQILSSSYQSHGTNFASEIVKAHESQKLNEDNSELENLFSFEDSIMESSNDSMITRPKSQGQMHKYNAVSEGNRREILEEQLLLLTEEGSAYLQKLNEGNKRKNNMKIKSKEQKLDAVADENEIDHKEEKYHLKTPSDSEVTHSDPHEGSSNNKNYPTTRSAYDYIIQKRKEEIKSSKKEIQGEILPHERFKKIILAVPTYSQHTQYDMAQELKKNVLYNNNDIVAIFKPYGIPVHGGGGDNKLYERLNITTLLPILAQFMKEEMLHPVHRLDLNTTGVMLLAKTTEMADTLKKMFKEHKIKKTYLAVTKGIPSPMNGVIDIPVGEGKVDRFQRRVLFPDIPGFRGRSGHSKKAITRYKVLSTANSTSLLEVSPITGVKHQVRVHLGFGINCPVLGDHKYSFLTKIAPQKLPGDTLERLGLKQSRVRALPLHLHAFSVNIPIYDNAGRDIFIRVAPPKFFRTTLQTLKLSSRRSRLTNDYSDLIYGYE